MKKIDGNFEISHLEIWWKFIYFFQCVASLKTLTSENSPRQVIDFLREESRRQSERDNAFFSMMATFLKPQHAVSSHLAPSHTLILPLIIPVVLNQASILLTSHLLKPILTISPSSHIITIMEWRTCGPHLLFRQNCLQNRQIHYKKKHIFPSWRTLLFRHY